MKLIGLISFLAFGISAVQAGAAAGPGFDATSVKVGTTLPLSGPLAGEGQAVMNGVNAYFSRINGEGGVHGRKLELLTYDDKYEPMNTQKGFKELVLDKGVFALLSSWGSTTAASIIPSVKSNHIPFVGVMASANFTRPPIKEVFLVRPTGFQEAENFIQFVERELGNKKIAIIYQDDPFGRTFVDVIKNHIETTKKSTLVGVASFIRNSEIQDSALKALAAKNPDIVFMAAVLPGSAGIMKKAAAIQFKTTFWGPTGTTTELFQKEIKDLGIEFFGMTSFPLLSDTGSDLVQNYLKDMKKFGQPASQIGVEGYLSAAVFVEALKRTGKELSRESFIQTLEGFKARNVSVFEFKIHYSEKNHEGLESPYLVKATANGFEPLKSLKKN